MQFLKKHNESIFLLVILLIAAFFRLYRIGDYLTFLGDEGRDVLVVKHILEGHFTLLGPRASAGDFYTGPIYYYMMAPFLWLWHLDPTGPAVMIALLSVATVFLIYKIGKEFFGEKAAVIAAVLYTVSPLVLEYARFSWNPNPMPFFTLLLLYTIYKGVQKQKWLLFLLSGLLYGIALQLHYIELFLAPVLFFFLLSDFFLQKEKRPITVLIKQYCLMVIGFIVGFLPFIAFELRHQFQNTQTIIQFILHGSPNATDLTHQPFFYKVYEVFSRVFGELLLRYPSTEHVHNYSASVLLIWGIGGLLIGLISLIALTKVKDRLIKTLFFLWIFFGVLLFGFYGKPIYDYYFEFLFPLPFLLFGFTLSLLTGKAGKKIALVVIAVLVIFDLFNTPFRYAPNHQKDQMKNISAFVLSKTDNSSFNFALLTKGNSDYSYRYYFEILGKPPVVIDNTINDPQRKTVTKQLLIVCEDVNCRPLGNPLFDVAGFGRAEIVGEWDTYLHNYGVKIYKLIQYKGT